MITLVDVRGNKSKVKVELFNDNTQCPLFKESMNNLFSGLDKIIWNYENDSELITLMYLKRWLDDNFDIKNVILEMPYIPNARMDRIKSNNDVFTLKYFAELLNSLNFKEVRVLDPHSYVSPALINNVKVITPEEYILRVAHDTESSYICYPDHGSEKRYSKAVKVPYLCGVKNRDWVTREILSLSIIDNGLDIKDRNILIVDDIIGTGGTILHVANKLKEMGAKNLYVYASHVEKTMLEGEMLSFVDRVYTPDLLFKEHNEKVEVLNGLY